MQQRQFQPGEAVYWCSLYHLAGEHRLFFGVVTRVRGARATLQIEGEPPRVVTVGNLVHAGWCEACQVPAHAHGGAPVCPRCGGLALPEPPPDSYYAPDFWPRLIRRLVRLGPEISRAEFTRERHALSEEDSERRRQRAA